MKKALLIFIFIISISSLFAQKKGIPIEGKCSEVINGLKDYLKNDTLVINYFKDFYKVSSINIPTDLYNKNASEIIDFFNEPVRKNSCLCRIRGWRERNVLLIE